MVLTTADFPIAPRLRLFHKNQVLALLRVELDFLDRRGLGRLTVRRLDMPEELATLPDERHALTRHASNAQERLRRKP